MAADARWPRVRELFHACQALAPGERDAWLERECAGDTALLDEVRDLLGAQAISGDLLAADASELIGRLRAAPAQALEGQRIGAYRLLRLLGEGGMGRVFLADRELAGREADGFEQRVALKLVRGDFIDAETRVRFLRERELLARLTHPHIAQLHDGGVAADGSPFFTLEYVEGEPITRWCDARRLGVRARLGLVLQVCAAVAHAHRNLIVHRDLKPSNILVTADGEAKLLDFGIAKLLDAAPGAGDTRTHARLMTPEYAAPEQILGGAVTTATDVYAIGVLLYELLAGRTPYARAEAGLVGWPEAVLHEVPEPMTRALARLPVRAGAGDGDTLAERRGTSVAGLRRTLRGDLERIVRRALAKEPEARHPSVAALADDVRAWLDGRAISGGSRRYRVRKFVARHWLPLGAAAAILGVIVAGAAAVAWQARETEREARTTLAVKDFLYGLFTAVDPRAAKGRDVSARELLDRGAARVQRDTALEPGQRAEIDATLGRIYYQLALYEQAKGLQEGASRLLAADPSRALLAARTDAERAETLAALGDVPAAKTLADDAIRRFEAAPDASVADRVNAWRIRARTAVDAREFVDAARFIDKALAHVDDPAIGDDLRLLVMMSAGNASWGEQKNGEAEQRYRTALAIASRNAGPDDLNVAFSQTSLGLALYAQSRYADAIEADSLALATYRKVLGEEHPTTLNAVRNIGLSNYQLGHYATSRELLERVASVQRARLGADHPALAGTDINIGLVTTDLGDLARAKVALAEAVSIFEKKFGRTHQGTRAALGNLAIVHELEGQLDLADAELTEIMQAEADPKLNELNGYTTLYRLGDVKRRRGDYATALALQRRALADSIGRVGEHARYTALAHEYLGLTLRDSGDVAGAERELRAALASFAGYLPGAEHPLAATARLDLGELLERDPAHRAEAVELITEAAREREKFLGATHPATVAAHAALAKAQGIARG